MPSGPRAAEHPRPATARRAPRQERSQQTVELMFEATARLIERDGLERLSTNRIAQESGLSIGSLYQYFPNKQSLLLAMAQREMERSAAEVDRAVRKERHLGEGAGARAAVRALFASIGPRHRVRRALIEAAAQAGRSDMLLAPLGQVESLLTDPAGPGMQPASAFVLASAVVGVLRASLLRDTSGAEDEALQGELLRLITSYRRACRQDTPSS